MCLFFSSCINSKDITENQLAKFDLKASPQTVNVRLSELGFRDIEYIPFLKIPYSLIYCNNHRFASRKDIRISDLDGERLLCPEAPFELNHVGDMLEKMFAEGGAHTFKKIQIHNYDEVPWLMKENDAIYISPMVNNQAYGSDTKYRFLLPELYHTDVSAVWLSKNTNAAIHLLCSAIKVCYP